MKNQNLLWAISGGRCEYEGCNTPLYMDILTKKKYNKAYIAHIVADSLDGPRGDPERSEKLANEISNLMLGSDDRIIGDQNRVRLCQPITNGPITANRGFILSLRNIQRLAKGIENAVELFYLFCIHINQFESFYKSLHVLYSGRRWSRAYPL